MWHASSEILIRVNVRFVNDPLHCSVPVHILFEKLESKDAFNIEGAYAAAALTGGRPSFKSENDTNSPGSLEQSSVLCNECIANKNPESKCL